MSCSPHLQKHQSRIYYLCVDHVIWTGRRILKLGSNVEMFFVFLFTPWLKKKYKLLWNFQNEITQPFFNLEGAPMCFTAALKNTKTIIIRYSAHYKHQKILKTLNFGGNNEPCAKWAGWNWNATTNLLRAWLIIINLFVTSKIEFSNSRI